MQNCTTVSLIKRPKEKDIIMNFKYITIEREYGSGGTKIARKLAEEPGLPCYGKEILEAVSKANDIPVKDIEKYEENVTGSFLYTLYALGKSGIGNSDMLSLEGHIFIAEQAEIQKMAYGGKAIFLGHCACEALKDQKGVLKVYIRCSDENEKKKRITEDYDIPERDVQRTQKHFNKKRANYYYANTAKRWDDMNNYDVILDSAVLGIDGCVNILKSVI